VRKSSLGEHGKEDDLRHTTAEERLKMMWQLAAGADYLIVGAHALAAHGYPRATGDLDIWVRPTQENADRVWDAIEKYGAPRRGITRDDFFTPDTVFQIGVAPKKALVAGG
jgi:hypothetical protein